MHSLTKSTTAAGGGIGRGTKKDDAEFNGRGTKSFELLQLATLEELTAAYIGAFDLVISCSRAESKGGNYSAINSKNESLRSSELELVPVTASSSSKSTSCAAELEDCN